MSHLFLFVLMLAPQKSPVTIQDWFEPLNRRYFAVAGDGHVYILDPLQRKVLHLDPDGRKLPPIGSPGAGPGEFIQPFDIFTLGNQVLVQDFMNGNIHCYENDGRLVRTIAGFRFTRILKVSSGWLIFKFTSEFLQISLVDESFGDQVVLDTWKLTQKQPSHSAYNPALDIPLPVTSADGQVVYIYRPGSVRIYKVDVGQKNISLFAEKKIDPVPFDLEWGRQKLEENRPRSQMGPAITLDAPKFFQSVRDLGLDWQGNLWVIRGNRPDLNVPPLMFDPSGKEISPTATAPLFPRLLALVGGQVYLATFDQENEQAGYIQYPVSEWLKTLK